MAIRWFISGVKKMAPEPNPAITRPEARPTTIRDEEIFLECGANGAAQVISFCRPILRSGLLLDDAPAEADTVALAVPNVHAEVRSFPSTTSSEGPR